MAIVFSVSIFAAAAGNPDVRVKLGTKEIAVSDIQIIDGRTYAPFGYLFQALGAKAVYDPDSGAVNADLGGTSVEFYLGDDLMTVTVGKSSQPIYMDTEPYQADSGMIYIPVRFAAQAFGYVVGWDAAGQTIVLQSIDDLIAQSGATYTILDKYLA